MKHIHTPTKCALCGNWLEIGCHYLIAGKAVCSHCIECREFVFVYDDSPPAEDSGQQATAHEGQA